eukprot:PhM_4_TR10928/c0_g1_i1/m.29009
MVYENLSAVVQSGPSGGCSALARVMDFAELEGLEVLMGTAQLKDVPWRGLNLLRRAVHPSYTTYNFKVDTVTTERTKGQQLRMKALQILASKTTFHNAWTEAMNHFISAAEHYTAYGDHVDSSECYKNAADCAVFLNQPVKAAELFASGGEQMISSGIVEDCIPLFDASIEIYQKLDHPGHVGRLNRRVADACIANAVVTDDVIDRYELAATQIKDKTLSDKCRFMYATLLCSERQQYITAIAIFELLAVARSCKVGMFFHAMLAALAAIVPGDRLPGIERAEAMFSRYQDEEVMFQVGAENILCRRLLEAWNTTNVALAEDIASRDMTLTSEWTLKMLNVSVDNLRTHMAPLM